MQKVKLLNLNLQSVQFIQNGTDCQVLPSIYVSSSIMYKQTILSNKSNLEKEQTKKKNIFLIFSQSKEIKSIIIGYTSINFLQYKYLFQNLRTQNKERNNSFINFFQAFCDSRVYSTLCIQRGFILAKTLSIHKTKTRGFFFIFICRNHREYYSYILYRFDFFQIK